MYSPSGEVYQMGRGFSRRWPSWFQAFASSSHPSAQICRTPQFTYQYRRQLGAASSRYRCGRCPDQRNGRAYV